MSEYTKKIVKIVVGIIALAVCLALVVIGHSIGSSGGLSTGIAGLGVELLGLAGVLVLLGVYNHGYQ
ncbi:MAG TPA: hypothetical protein H9795_01230 [Candidatus Fournierella merdigallinarum]|nr:hypothetical protein [Candidatus Fournierella merdigallinarum]